MNSETIGKLRGYVNALRALSRSVERSLMQHAFEGTGELAMRGYVGLHKKVAELLPEDFYVTESLKLEAKEGSDDKKILAQVQMASGQLVTYLEGMLRDAGDNSGRRGWGAPWDQFIPPTPPTPPGAPQPPQPPNPPDWRGLGRDLQEQIMGITRHTLRRALANIDWDVSSVTRGVDMQGEDLTGRDFRSGRLVSANLSGVTANGVTFEDAGLVNVNFTDAALTDTNFQRARLENCKFNNATLENARLEGTVFVNCDFSGANLTGAQLEGARFVNPNFTNTVMPDGQAYAGDLRKFGAVVVIRKVEINKGDRKFKVEIDFDDDEEKAKPDDMV